MFQLVSSQAINVEHHCSHYMLSAYYSSYQRHIKLLLSYLLTYLPTYITIIEVYEAMMIFRTYDSKTRISYNIFI